MVTEINNCLEILRKGGTILCPTDTVWGIGCDATNEAAVEKVYRLKNRVESKSLIILIADQKMLPLYVRSIPKITYDLLKSIDKPLTVIYPDAQNLAGNVVAGDNSIAIRIVHSGFCHDLIRAFGKPIVSTSANISGEATPVNFRQISVEIKNGVDYAVDEKMDTVRNVQPSQIIKINHSGEFQIIRK
jgi:L-threonylcarbamoyladenylate synthase